MSTASLRKRLEAATPAPWAACIDIPPDDGAYWDGMDVIAVDELPVPDYPRGLPDNEGEAESERVSAWADKHERGVVAETHNHSDIPDEQHDANQRLIAHAPTDLRLALDVIEAAKQRIGGSHAMGCDSYAAPDLVRCDCGLADLRAALDAFEASE